MARIEVKGNLFLTDGVMVDRARAQEICKANRCKTTEAFGSKYSEKFDDGQIEINDDTLKVISPAKKKAVKIPDTTVQKMKETIKGRYDFTVEEIRDMGQRQAAKYSDRSILLDEKKSILADFNQRMKGIELELAQLSRHIQDGYEYRDFECTVTINWVKKTKTYINSDKKVIKEAPLDPSDMQLRLDLEEREKAKEEREKENKLPEPTAETPNETVLAKKA